MRGCLIRRSVKVAGRQSEVCVCVCSINESDDADHQYRTGQLCIQGQCHCLELVMKVHMWTIYSC